MSKKISSSPDRHTFQKEKYIERQQEKSEPVNEDYLLFFEKIIESDRTKWDNPQAREDNLEYDLLTTEWILQKVRDSQSYAQNLYAAMCNNSFQKREVMPILKNDEWSCSWRYAGGIIADMRQEGDYIDWYCSGIRDSSNPSKEEWDKWTEEQQQNWTNIYSKYVGESVVTDEIKQDLKLLGWNVIEDSE